MANSTEPEPWFEFRIEETEGRGVDIEKLTRVLSDLTSAFYAIARAKLGKPNRPGPHTPDEQVLASIRILRVTPGSAVIEADPPASGLQGQFVPFADQTTADDVAYDLVQEMQRLHRREGSLYTRPDVRQRVQALVRGAGEIGKVAEAVHRPRRPVSPGMMPGAAVRARMATSDLPEEQEAPAGQPRTRRIAGHAYMVDVEPGKWRIRLKLPDGRDLTLDASPELADILKQAVDQVVEIESVEEFVGDVVSSRTAVNLNVLPSAGPGSTQPPKSIEELAVEQGMPAERPDYKALASAVWETEEELAEFEEYLKQTRQSGVA